MPSQRSILGTGLAVLLAISAASIGLDVKSRCGFQKRDERYAWLDQVTMPPP
jgi:hypothetical protein